MCSDTGRGPEGPPGIKCQNLVVCVPSQSQEIGGHMSSQKFIARNRAPRVQIEYDVELYGAQKKVQLPFVMGVMADLSGNPKEPLPAVADRKFLEIDVDNFDERMKAMKPRVAFQVPNTLTGRGQPDRRHDLREHGRLLAGGRRPQGRGAQQAARGPRSSWPTWSRTWTARPAPRS